MNEYSEIQVRRQFPIKTVWETEYGPIIVIGHVPDMDGMGYIVACKAKDDSQINIHPYFIGKRIS